MNLVNTKKEVFTERWRFIIMCSTQTPCRSCLYRKLFEIPNPALAALRPTPICWSKSGNGLECLASYQRAKIYCSSLVSFDKEWFTEVNQLPHWERTHPMDSHPCIAALLCISCSGCSRNSVQDCLISLITSGIYKLRQLGTRWDIGFC